MNTENTTDREKFLIAEALFDKMKLNTKLRIEINRGLAKSKGAFETSQNNEIERILKTNYKTYYDLFLCIEDLTIEIKRVQDKDSEYDQYILNQKV
jgi:hypothetical protein